MADNVMIPVSRETKERLEGLKPFESMTWNDLVIDMADHYEAVIAEYEQASDRALSIEGGPG